MNEFLTNDSLSKKVESSEFKLKTIQSLNDYELDLILNRLRKELEAQRIIQDLRYNAKRGVSDVETFYDNKEPIDTVTPIKDMYHYGVLGMRWGVRRSRRFGGDGTAYEKGMDGNKGKRKQYSKKVDKVVRAKQAEVVGRRKTISLSELENQIRRLKLEREFKSLSDEDLAPGKKFLKDLSSDVVKTTTRTLLTTASVYGAAKLLGRSGGDRTSPQEMRKELASIIIQRLKKK